MLIDANIVRAVTHEVCNTTLGMPVMDRETAEILADAGRVSAEVLVEGDWNARISIIASKDLARELAGRMFQQDLDAVGQDDLEDSLCEFANIIGGNLKGIVGQEANLSIPSYHEGETVCVSGDGLSTAFAHDSSDFCIVVDAK